MQKGRNRPCLGGQQAHSGAGPAGHIRVPEPHMLPASKSDNQGPLRLRNGLRRVPRDLPPRLHHESPVPQQYDLALQCAPIEPSRRLAFHAWNRHRLLFVPLCEDVL